MLIWAMVDRRCGPERKNGKGGDRDGQKTKGRCHVGAESLIDVMCSAARRQWFR